jgi:uncharacterized repeat protein (TIGR03803 family)
MTKTQGQSWISRMRAGVTTAALSLAAVVGGGTVASQSLQAQTFTVLYNFNLTDGGIPYSTLARDAAGNLYGTTQVGGAIGVGTVFKVDAGGTETVLYSFTGGADGGYPLAGLVLDAAENLYGTTSNGGAYLSGTVFKVSKTGVETVIHSFDGTDGCIPLGGLIRDTAGNLYGTTNGCGSFGFGTVFKVSKAGKETTLHNFAGPPIDGAYPQYASLLMDTNGNLYGVTQQGGNSCFEGCGTVFKLNAKGKETVLHNFAGGTKDGCTPTGTLINDAEGNLYGTAQACGASSLGIVWKLTSKGTETILHSFSGQNGVAPVAGVIRDTDGNLYGDTAGGGPLSEGVVYKLNKSGKETVLHSFTLEDGGSPLAGVTMDSKGNLYGAALVGGTNDAGTVWKLTAAQATAP